MSAKSARQDTGFPGDAQRHTGTKWVVHPHRPPKTPSGRRVFPLGGALLALGRARAAVFPGHGKSFLAIVWLVAYSA